MSILLYYLFIFLLLQTLNVLKKLLGEGADSK